MQWCKPSLELKGFLSKNFEKQDQARDIYGQTTGESILLHVFTVVFIVFQDLPFDVANFENSSFVCN